jgi:hypothetical protein
MERATRSKLLSSVSNNERSLVKQIEQQVGVDT